MAELGMPMNGPWTILSTTSSTKHTALQEAGDSQGFMLNLP